MPISTPEALAPSYGGDREHFRHVLDYLFIPALTAAGLNPIPPFAEGADVIHAEIIKNLETADLVLCDASSLNPNVFFELGIRTALNKPVCIVRDELTPKIPFDTTIINHHTYHSSLSPWTLKEQVDCLVKHIKSSSTRSGGANMLWKYFGLRSQAVPEPPKGGTEDRLDLLSMQIEGLANELRKRPSEGFADEDHDSTLAKSLIRGVALLGAKAKRVVEGGDRVILLIQGQLKPGEQDLLTTLAQVHGKKLTIQYINRPNQEQPLVG